MRQVRERLTPSTGQAEAAGSSLIQTPVRQRDVEGAVPYAANQGPRVIANQCSHWCGDGALPRALARVLNAPSPFRGNPFSCLPLRGPWVCPSAHTGAVGVPLTEGVGAAICSPVSAHRTEDGTVCLAGGHTDPSPVLPLALFLPQRGRMSLATGEGEAYPIDRPGRSGRLLPHPAGGSTDARPQCSPYGITIFQKNCPVLVAFPKRPCYTEKTGLHNTVFGLGDGHE